MKQQRCRARFHQTRTFHSTHFVSKNFPQSSFLNIKSNTSILYHTKCHQYRHQPPSPPRTSGKPQRLSRKDMKTNTFLKGTDTSHLREQTRRQITMPPKQSTNGSRQASQDHHRCLSGQLYLHDTVWFWRRYAGCVRIDYMIAENKVF